jgi:hypothetical protein
MGLERESRVDLPGGTRRESVPFSHFMSTGLGIVDSIFWVVLGWSSPARRWTDVLRPRLIYGLVYLYQPDRRVIEIADFSTIFKSCSP